MQFVLALRCRPPLQINQWQVHRRRLGDHLYRTAILSHKTRAQCFVPGDDRVERLLQRLAIEPPVKPDRRRKVVEGAIRLQLVEKPNPLLCEGERRMTALGAPRNCRPPRLTSERATQTLFEQRLFLSREFRAPRRNFIFNGCHGCFRTVHEALPAKR